MISDTIVSLMPCLPWPRPVCWWGAALLGERRRAV